MARERTSPIGSGRFDPNRKAWLMVDKTEFVFYSGPDEYEGAAPDDEIRHLSIRQGTSTKTVRVFMESMTADELVVLRDFLGEVIAASLPEAARRDAVAEREMATGGTTMSRAYRPPPQIVRARKPRPPATPVVAAAQ